MSRAQVMISFGRPFQVLGRVMTLLLFTVGSLSLSGCGYNSLVSQRENVDQAWAQVQNVYQRRADLIPNLVETVKASGRFEQETLTQVIEARSRATSIQLNADQLTEENLRRFEQAQGQLTGALSRLMAVSENYPQLQTTQAFRDLTQSLEGSENRITVERRNFNSAVQSYNTSLSTFPNNLTARMFGFERRAYFQATTPGAETAPRVQF